MTREWHGTFISWAEPSAACAPAVYFRREFAVGRLPLRAPLTVTVLGIVAAHLNGGRVGDDVRSPAWTSYRHHVDRRSYDVTDLLVAIPNALGAVVGDGRASGASTWENKRATYGPEPPRRLRCRT